MIRIMDDLPDEVLGVSAEGYVTKQDYESILMPALWDKAATHDEISLLYVAGSGFSGFDFPTACANTTDAAEFHALPQWDKVAFVSDSPLMDAVASFFGFLLSCEVRIYATSELEDAKKWILNEGHVSFIDELHHLISQDELNTNFPLSGGAPE